MTERWSSGKRTVLLDCPDVGQDVGAFGNSRKPTLTGAKNIMADNSLKELAFTPSRQAARGILREYLRQLERVRCESPGARPHEQQTTALFQLMGAIEFHAEVRAGIWEPESLRRELAARKAANALTLCFAQKEEKSNG